MFNKVYFKKKVLITGHTGFKGKWLTLWLSLLGAKVYGFSNEKRYFSNIFFNKKVVSVNGDISDFLKIKNLINKVTPDFIFHFAAQALVSESYVNPYKTWLSNVMGTINILESCRSINKKLCLILITSDKAYKNIEKNSGYRETDELNGNDPYSASKSSADIAIQSYFKSVLNKKKNIKGAITRAGNVIGGGDLSKDRIIPDFYRAYIKKKKLLIKNPFATRPWQFVLEPLSGYLLLGKLLYQNKINNHEAFNFGPKPNYNFQVLDLINEIHNNNIKLKFKITNKRNEFKESKLLKLNSKKARINLKWKPVLTFKETIRFTIDWYKGLMLEKNSSEMRKLSIFQIEEYFKKAKKLGLDWTK